MVVLWNKTTTLECARHVLTNSGNGAAFLRPAATVFLVFAHFQQAGNPLLVVSCKFTLKKLGSAAPALSPYMLLDIPAKSIN